MTTEERISRAKTIRTLYNHGKGLSPVQLAAQFGMSVDYIYTLLSNRVSVDPDYVPLDRKQAIEFKDEIVRLRKQKFSLREIGQMVGEQARGKAFCEQTIRVVLKSHKFN